LTALREVANPGEIFWAQVQWIFIGADLMSEGERKLKIIRNWMTRRNFDGLLLRRVSSFAWATCGAASCINRTTTDGVSSLLITQDYQYLITKTIEAPA
jgi:hypothetical protein